MTALAYQDEWPLLIVCPSSLKLNWAVEIERWIGLNRECVQVVATAKESLDGLVCIISYDLARGLKEKLHAKKFQVVIADEAHYLKNGKAERTMTVVPILQAARRALLLTGTPALSRPIEIYQLLRALQPKLFPVEIQFGVRYCNSFQGPFGWQHNGSSNEDELHTFLSNTVMIRREKKDVLKVRCKHY